MTPERPLDPPDHKPFTGRVTFAAYVNDETVEVDAKIKDDCIDWGMSWVWWRGNDVEPLLHASQKTAIENQFSDEYYKIIAFDEN